MPTRDEDMSFMRRAINLAMRGRGRVEPNPMVGCVIVKDGRVIGEGWHQQYGGPHAEPNALAACGESPAGATAYVTLEPCCHTNKQTPPCVPRLIEAKIARLVVGAIDPNPAVAGRGVTQLREAGIEVVTGVLQRECCQLVAMFICRMSAGRPYVTMKWAETADGKVAGPNGSRLQISSAASMRAVHVLRSRYASILVGINTVLADDPLLTSRGAGENRGLTRRILDRDLRLLLTSRIVQTLNECETVLYCSAAAAATGADKVRQLMELGLADLVTVDLEAEGLLSLSAVLADLHHWPMPEVLVEPGPTLALSFFSSGLVDRLWVFRSPNRVDDSTAPKATAVPSHYVPVGSIELGGDVLTEYLNPASPVFFAAEASADFRIVVADVGCGVN